MLFGGLRELPERPLYCLEVDHTLKAEQTSQHRIMVDDFSVLETIGTVPDRVHELQNEPLATIDPIAP